MNTTNCFECGSDESIHQHHVVPRSLGGTKTLPLCGRCHGLVHGMKLENHANLTAIGLAEARRRGKTLGRPVGTTMPRAEFLAKHADVVKHLKAGQSIRHAAKISGKSKGTVENVKHAMG